MRQKEVINIFVLMMILFMFTYIGCGRKAWPTATSKEDSFSFSHLSYRTTKRCLKIKGHILGNIYNLKEIILEIEFKDKNTCITCPFVSQKKVIFLRNNTQLYIKEHSFVLTYCKEEEKEIERVRLVGINKFKTIGPVYSNIINLTTQTKRNKEKN